MNDDEFDELDDLEEEELYEESNVNDDDDWNQSPYEDYNNDNYYEVDELDGSSEMLEDLLYERGITDPENIKFEGYDGIVRNRSWNDLTYDEQFNILSQNPDADPERELDDDEIDLINEIRLSGLSTDEYTDALLDYQEEPEYEENQTYAIDNLTDDELFVLDLQAKSEEISDDEALLALENAKYNGELFAKQMEGIRNEYRLLEDDRNQLIYLDQKQREEDDFNEFASNINDEIYNLNNIGTLDINLDEDDREAIADFILSKDSTGISYFGKILNDPEKLTQMAWFALYGEDTFNEINSYMSDQIKRAALAGYNKGLQEGRYRGHTVVINNPRRSSNYESYDELDDLD